MFRQSWGLGAIALCCFACDTNPGDRPTFGTFEDPPPGEATGGSSFDSGGTGFGGTFPTGQPTLPGAVFSAAEPPAPVSGGTLLISRDETLAIVADPDRDRVFVVDLQALSLVHDIQLPAGSEPGRAAEDAAGHVHVALRGTGKLSTLDISAGTVLGTRSVCRYPRGVAVADADKQVHVACAEGQLISLSTDPASAEPERSLLLDRDLRDVVLAKDGLWVSRFRSAEILRLDAAGEITRRIRLPAVKSFNGSSVAAVAWRMVATAEGGVMVVHQRAFTGEVVPSPGGYGGPGGGGIVQTGISLVDDDGVSRSTGVALSAPLPVDVAESATSGQLLVATAAIEPAQSFNSNPSTPLLSKDALAFSEAPAIDGFTVTDSVPGLNTLPTSQIVAVGFAGDVPVLQLREPSSLVVGDKGLVLPGESIVDTGSTLFHLRTSSGLACASCHPEGQEDGHVWNFQGFGARRTQSLRGGLLGTEPLHWDGAESDFTALTKDVMELRMGGPTLTQPQVDAMASYIDRFAAIPSSNASTPQAELGKQLFESEAVGCATCHSGARLSNDKSMDVGSGLLQVPSLVGLWARAPYLHDGCAKTLDERFTNCDTGGKHGDVSALDTEDLAALNAYLETL